MVVYRILHVENEPEIREVVAASLSLDPGLETRSCGSGVEALDIAVKWSPDLILLDVMMPGMDGPAVLSSLKENIQTTRIPVVFMTARLQTREIDLFRSLGAAGVISKPFDPMTLADTLRTYLNRADFGLEAMRNVFLQRVRDETAVLMKYRPLLRDDSAASELLTKVRDIAHGLSGAGGIFGFAEISDLAALLEDSIGLELCGAGSIEDIAHDLDRLIACTTTTGVYQAGPAVGPAQDDPLGGDRQTAASIP
jgi:CheY-like chemotaxis protein